MPGYGPTNQQPIFSQSGQMIPPGNQMYNSIPGTMTHPIPNSNYNNSSSQNQYSSGQSGHNISQFSNYASPGPGMSQHTSLNRAGTSSHGNVLSFPKAAQVAAQAAMAAAANQINTTKPHLLQPAGNSQTGTLSSHAFVPSPQHSLAPRSGMHSQQHNQHNLLQPNPAMSPIVQSSSGMPGPDSEQINLGLNSENLDSRSPSCSGDETVTSAHVMPREINSPENLSTLDQPRRACGSYSEDIEGSTSIDSKASMPPIINVQDSVTCTSGCKLTVQGKPIATCPDTNCQRGNSSENSPRDIRNTSDTQNLVTQSSLQVTGDSMAGTDKDSKPTISYAGV